MDTPYTQKHKMPQTRIFFLIIILVLFGANVFMFVKYEKLVDGDASPTTVMEKNTKLVDFTHLLVTLLLKSNTVTDDERILLESSVRDIGDKEVLEAWKDFTGSETQTSAQDHLVTLLDVLLSKIETDKSFAALCSI